MQPKEWRVLIIEDEEDSSEVVREILEYYGCKTWEAPNAEYALDLIPKVQPNLLVVDLALPGMDGWGFLKTVQETPSSAILPAVAVTAYHSIYVARQAIDAGFSAYFPKPLDTTSFVRELCRIME